MTETTTLHLKKPDASDFYNVEDFNNNADKVDEAVAQLQTATEGKADKSYVDEQLEGKADKSDIPTKLPANGGNADTVDGKHACEMLQNLGYLNSGSLLNYAIVEKTSGFVFVGNEVTGMPYDSTYWFASIEHTTDHCKITATDINTSKTFIDVYNDVLKKWSGWSNVADGGDALTLNGVAASEYLQRIRHGVNIGTNPTATDNRGLYFLGKDSAALATGSITNAIATNGDSVTTIDARNNKASDQARYRIDIRSNADGSGYVAVTAPSSSGRSALRNISSGSPAATTALCPAGAWYGQYE